MLKELSQGQNHNEGPGKPGFPVAFKYSSMGADIFTGVLWSSKDFLKELRDRRAKRISGETAGNLK